VTGARLFSRAGIADPTVVAASGQQHLDHPDRFWDIALGSGYRATIDALSPEQQDRLRVRLLGELRSHRITAVRTDVVFGQRRGRISATLALTP
jgi:hypothetical protein